jgi:hypothetical protein
MPMVAFSAFVVIADDALARITVKQAVLEWVRTANNRLGHLPDGHFDDCSIGKFRSIIKRALGLHMARCAMNGIWRQATYMEFAGDAPSRQHRLFSQIDRTYQALPSPDASLMKWVARRASG